MASYEMAPMNFADHRPRASVTDNFSPWKPATRSRLLLAGRIQPRSAVRRSFLCRHRHHGYLLQARLPVSFGHPESIRWFQFAAAAEAAARPCRRSSGHLTGECRVVWNLGCRIPVAQADLRRRAGRRQFGAACRPRRHRFAPSAPTVSTASGRFASEDCAVSSRARRAKPDRGNATSGHRNRPGHRLPEHSSVQSFRTHGLRAVSHSVTPPSWNCRSSRPPSRDHRSSALSPAL